MGNSGSTSAPPRPNKVSLTDFLEGKNNSHKHFAESLRDRGFGVITLDEKTQALVQAMLQVSDQFFSQTLEDKKKIIKEREDPILRTMGVKANAGYLHVPRVKEYIKLKLSDPDSMFPAYPSDYKDKFTPLFEQFRIIAHMAFKVTACFQAKATKKQLKILPEDATLSPNPNFKSEPGTHSYMRQTLWEDVDKLSWDRSSVSVINYFRQIDLPAVSDSSIGGSEGSQPVGIFSEEAKSEGVSDSDKKDEELKKEKEISGSVTEVTTSPLIEREKEVLSGSQKDVTKPEKKAEELNEGLKSEVIDGSAKETASDGSKSSGKEEGIRSTGDKAGEESDKLREKEAAEFAEAISEACKVHTDTGVLTLIMCSSVSALQILSREEKDKWLEVEQSHTPGVDLFVIGGRKLEMFARTEVSDTFPATVHRVMLPNNLQRYSLLYFMDARNQDG